MWEGRSGNGAPIQSEKLEKCNIHPLWKTTGPHNKFTPLRAVTSASGRPQAVSRRAAGRPRQAGTMRRLAGPSAAPPPAAVACSPEGSNRSGVGGRPEHALGQVNSKFSIP